LRGPDYDEGVSGLSIELRSEPPAPRSSGHPAVALLDRRIGDAGVRTGWFGEHDAPLVRKRDNGAAFRRDELARMLSPYGVAVLYAPADTLR
jgi:hypothetical protein